MNNNRKSTLALAVVLATGATLATAGPASARGGDGVTAHGQCSGSATWKLKAKPDNGRVEVEFEVDSNRVGQTWSVRLHDNGQRFFAGSRTTQAPSGSFSVHKLTANRAGSDVIRARATHGAQTCRGSVTL
ncbi:MAG: hypothetical protein QOJ03_3373 [Frankiaceae bacterium]|jgi:hypothetical protein|nr:hypothetical protein [Frankiaceae bacterium]